jgi:regulator of sigma E protease
METLLLGLWSEWLWPILQFVVGLGLVIFAHELGHFIAAKAVDIRVEQFALGFGTRLFGFKRGETDYRINLLPLGGYVKMAGQEDFAPLTKEERPDPRAFPNKSIGQRFTVISAGVIMNVILAAVLFIIVCLAGIRFLAPVIGGTLPGSPARHAEIRWLEKTYPPSMGLEAGDKILAVGEKPIDRFPQLAVIAALSAPDREYDVILERKKDQEILQGITRIGVMNVGGTLQFGLLPAFSTTFGPLGDSLGRDPFVEGDRVVAIEGQRIEHYWQIAAVEEKLDGGPVRIALLRDDEVTEVKVRPDLRMDPGVFFRTDGARVSGEIVSVAGYPGEEGTVSLRLPEDEQVKLLLREVTWPARSAILDIVGLVPRLRVTGVMKKSPAFHAGILPEDIIVEYDGIPSPTLQQFLDINTRVADTLTSVIVLRGDEPLSLQIQPTRHKGRVVAGIIAGPDLANPVIAHVREGSPAAAAGMAAGISFTRVNEKRMENWIDLFNVLRTLQGEKAAIHFRGDPVTGTEEVAQIGFITDRIFHPDDYRFVLFPGPRSFTLLMGEEVKMNPPSAVIWGFQETLNFITMTYATLVSYFRGTVSAEEFRGPVGIGSIAIQAGREGVVPFIYFLAVISVSLAVINFLPIPVVDGGHAVFLLIEKILGRPVPLQIQNMITMIGWGLLLFLIIALTWNDIVRILSNL